MKSEKSLLTKVSSWKIPHREQAGRLNSCSLQQINNQKRLSFNASIHSLVLLPLLYGKRACPVKWERLRIALTKCPTENKYSRSLTEKGYLTG
jgi:hypothetical protein